MHHPTQRFGLIAAEDHRHMSGLEFLRAMIDGRLPAPPIMETMSFLLREVGDGEATVVCTPSLKHYNPIGSVHGGLAGTLLDTCMSCAVHTQLAAGQGYTTLDYHVHLVRPLTDQTGEITARGLVIHRGRRVATAEGRIEDAAGRLHAHGTATCLILEP